jgi:hypothetical protein
MTVRMTRKDRVLVLLASTVLLGVGALGWWLLGEVTLMLLLVLAAMLILAVLGEGYRRLSQALSDTPPPSLPAATRLPTA